MTAIALPSRVSVALSWCDEVDEVCGISCVELILDVLSSSVIEDDDDMMSRLDGMLVTLLKEMLVSVPVGISLVETLVVDVDSALVGSVVVGSVALGKRMVK